MAYLPEMAWEALIQRVGMEANLKVMQTVLLILIPAGRSTKTRDMPSGTLNARQKDEEVTHEEILELHPG